MDEPLEIPRFCDDCNADFCICHALDCKKGSLVTERQREIRDGVADLTIKAFIPTHVHDTPHNFAGRAVQRIKAHPARSTEPPPKTKSEVKEQKGNRLIHDFWQNGSTITLSKLPGSTLGTFTVGHCLGISLHLQTLCTE